MTAQATLLAIAESNTTLTCLCRFQPCFACTENKHTMLLMYMLQLVFAEQALYAEVAHF